MKLVNQLAYLFQKAQHLSVLDVSDDSFQRNDDRFELFKTLSVFVNSIITFGKPYGIQKMCISSTQSHVDDKFCTYSVNTRFMLLGPTSRNWISGSFPMMFIALNLPLISPLASI
jgi:hypothetical protein